MLHFLRSWTGPIPWVHLRRLGQAERHVWTSGFPGVWKAAPLCTTIAVSARSRSWSWTSNNILDFHTGFIAWYLTTVILFLWCVYGKQGPEYRDHDMFIPIFRGCGVRDDWWYIWSGSHCDVAVDVQYMSSIGQLSPSDLMIFRLVNSYSIIYPELQVYSIGFHPHKMGCWLVNPRLCSINWNLVKDLAQARVWPWNFATLKVHRLMPQIWPWKIKNV